MTRLLVDLVTNIPTPYNQAFFSDMTERVDLRVHYMGLPSNEGRPWGIECMAGHEAIVYPGFVIKPLGWWNPRLLSDGIRPQTDVLILAGSYLAPTITALMVRRGTHLRMFWGERQHARRPLVNAIISTLMNRVDMVLAIGEKAATDYRRLSAGPVHVLPYTVGTPGFCALGSDRIVGFCGQLIERKGLDLLLRAASGLGDVSVDVIGSGPDEQVLRALSRHLGVEVNWIGEQTNSDLAALSDHWTCQVVPSRYDGWGVVVNEALASGRPVVVSDSVGAVDLVRQGVNGWVAIGGDAESLASQLARALARGSSLAVRAAAAATGAQFASSRAADFLCELLEGSTRPRSFITEQWQRYDNLEKQLPGSGPKLGGPA